MTPSCGPQSRDRWSHQPNAATGGRGQYNVATGGRAEHNVATGGRGQYNVATGGRANTTSRPVVAPGTKPRPAVALNRPCRSWRSTGDGNRLGGVACPRAGLAYFPPCGGPNVVGPSGSGQIAIQAGTSASAIRHEPPANGGILARPKTIGALPRTTSGRGFVEKSPATGPKPPAVPPQTPEKKAPEKKIEKPPPSPAPGIANAPAVPPKHKPPERLAVPDEEDQKKAEATIRNDLMKNDFKSADRPAKKVLLAKKLLGEGLRYGSRPAGDVAVNYMLLRLACREAANGDTETAMLAIDALDGRFQIDALAMRLETLETLARSPAAAVLPAIMVGQMLAAAGEAVKGDRYDLSGRSLVLAKAVIAKARDAMLAKQIKARTTQAVEASRAYEAMEESLRGLEQHPDDPALNEAVGKYYCLDKGRWERGLPRLAAGGNDRLKRLAQSDLAAPQDAHARLDLANAWWDFAEELEGAGQLRVRSHAGEWYRKSEKDLAGLSQTKAKQRSAEAAKAAAADEGTAADVPDKWDNLQCREPRSRAVLLKRFGGNEASEVAVDRALGWLEGHQNPDGSWRFDRVGRGRDSFPPIPARQRPHRRHVAGRVGLPRGRQRPAGGKIPRGDNQGLKALTRNILPDDRVPGDRAGVAATRLPRRCLPTPWRRSRFVRRPR